MSPPINIDGSSVSSVTIDGTSVSEVTVDGEAVFSAIPDSALYHYPLLERSTSTLEEQLADADATANGTTNISGTWKEGYAESGDGTDDHISGPIEWTNWIESNQNKYLIFTVDADPSNYSGRQGVFGTFDTGPDPSEEWLMNDDGTGIVTWRMSGNDGNQDLITTDSAIFDGSKKRLVLQRTGSDGNSLEIWVNGSEEPVTVNSAQGFNGTFDGTMDPYALAKQGGSGISEAIPSGIDNIIFGQQGETLTQQEIQDDYNRQPWS